MIIRLIFYNIRFKREVYVAITRAKQNLSIHTNGHYLSNIANGLAEYRINSNTYPAPQSLCYTLTHRDLWLDFFIDSHCQAAINTLKSGMSLRLTEKGCTDFSNNEILRFSKKFKDILNELIQKDYKLEKLLSTSLYIGKNRKIRKKPRLYCRRLFLKRYKRKLDYSVIY